MCCAGASVSYTARLAETEAENARLRTLLDFRKTLGGKLLTARVIGAVVLGVNERSCDPAKHHIVSNGGRPRSTPTASRSPPVRRTWSSAAERARHPTSELLGAPVTRRARSSIRDPST